MLHDGEIKLSITISLTVVLELRKTWMPTMYYNVFKGIDQESQNIDNRTKSEIPVLFSKGSLNQDCSRSQLLIRAFFQPPADYIYL